MTWPDEFHVRSTTMTEVVQSVAELRQALARRRIVGSQIGFVPTMGALHEGHLSLMRRSVSDCDATVVSVFVNPLQFGPREDLSSYPRDFDRDVALTESAGVGLVFAPPVEEMYPVPLLTTVAVREMTEPFEGEKPADALRGRDHGGGEALQPRRPVPRPTSARRTGSSSRWCAAWSTTSRSTSR